MTLIARPQGLSGIWREVWTANRRGPLATRGALYYCDGLRPLSSSICPRHHVGSTPQRRGRMPNKISTDAANTTPPLSAGAIIAQQASTLRRPNLLKNGNFDETAVDQFGKILTTTPPGFGYLPSAAPHWDMINNQPGDTTTALFPSTRVNGGRMLHVCTFNIQGGLRQSFGAHDTGPATTNSSAWVYVLSGQVGMGTGNEGATSDTDDVSHELNTWTQLHAPNGVSPANMFLLYAKGSEGACFFVDSAAVFAA
jgi:hypothetical protein